MGTLKVVCADAAISFLWMAATTCMGTAVLILENFLGLQHYQGLVINAILASLIFSFSVLGAKLGGASWNPTGPLAFYVTGDSKDTLLVLALRLPATAIGSAAGAWAAFQAMPFEYRYTLGGPSLQVDPPTGAFVEGVFTFLITLIVLWTALRGPKSETSKNFVIIAAVLLLVSQGSTYTGPAMNPSSAFGWAYVNNKHTTKEHILVYWVAPFIGTLAAANVFQLMFSAPVPREKAD